MKNMILKNTIRSLFCILLVFTSVKTAAQGDDKPSSYFPTIAPTAPNSASLGLYGQVPISPFTGNANISIPLLEIKSNSLVMPISLSYSSDGIKVDQYESNVGMGWALNVGGVITRQVFDRQDNYNGRLQKPNVAAESSEMAQFLQQASDGPEVDTQPDIFNYNINGMSGKFILDNLNMPVEIEPSGLKIEVTSEFLNGGSESNPEIIITDTKGIKYYFGGVNATESSASRRIFVEGPNPISDDVITSWYLTKIEDTTTNNQITLSYDSRNITYVTGNEQSLEYYYASQIPSATTATLHNFQFKSYSTESLLKEINTNNYKISFVYSKRFTDPDFPLSKVDEISYSNTQGTLIKKIKLDYDEYSGNTFPNNYNQSILYFKKRFFLKQINEFSTNTNPITHQFEYYSPEELPARFSFAQDNYGVFNGKVNSSLISDEIAIPNSILYRVFSDSKLANRKPDRNFGYYGLLKKIIYPTKGNTILEYEPHVKGKKDIPILPAKTYFDLNVYTNGESFNNSNTTTIHSSLEQTIKINGNVTNNCPEENPFPLQAIVEITDLSTNTLVSFWKMGSNSDYPILIGSSYTITSTPSTTEDTFTLEANKDYSIKINLLRPCMFSHVFFNYYSAPITFQEIENEIGGFRISKIIKDNSITGILEKEKYYYSQYNCLTCQTGFYISQVPPAYINKIERDNACESPRQRTLYSVASSNLARIYSSQNVQFGYEYVTKSYGDNFENGGEESKYEIVQDGLPILKQGFEDKTTPFTNGFGSGKLLAHKIFNRAFKVIKETVNQYQHDISRDKSFRGYNVYFSNQIYILSSGFGCFSPIASNLYSLSEYDIRSQWHYLKQSIETQYDLNGLNPVTITKDYSYNNSNHLQLSSLKSSTSITGQTLETKYFYSLDNEMINEPFRNELITSNMVGIPLDTQTFKSAVKLSEQKTVYEKGTTTNNLLLPKNVLVAKFPNATNGLENKITYDQYDDKGNLLQYTVDRGTSVAVIWGYSQTQPIAKIENATYGMVTAYVANLQTLSSIGTEASLLTALDNLRNASELTNAIVTTYTYKPLIGVSTITDSKGYRLSYEYDEFNRLKLVKDAQGNILSENQYHYKN